jgi:hypothetical protein
MVVIASEAAGSHSILVASIPGGYITLFESTFSEIRIPNDTQKLTNSAQVDVRSRKPDTLSVVPAGYITYKNRKSVKPDSPRIR